MAEDKEEEFKKDHYKRIDKGVKATAKYIAKIQDRNFAGVKAANEEIDYKFDELDDEEIQDKYMKKISEYVRDDIVDEFGLEDYDEEFIDTFIRTMGGITYEEIKKIVKGRGEKFNPDHLIRSLEQSKNQFAQRHYQGIASKYVTEKKHFDPALKYLGLEDKVDKDKVTIEHFPQWFAAYGVENEVRDQYIPDEIRKSRKTREEEKEKDEEKTTWKETKEEREEREEKIEEEREDIKEDTKERLDEDED